MKCAVCGKEFGSGINCQSCGVDKVTGLANYSGYDNSAGNSHLNSSNKMEYVSNRTTVCYSCGEIIPSDAEYCPYCRKKLYEECPKCGKTYSSQFDNCPKCGTNRYEYHKEMQDREKEDRKRQLEETRKKHAQEREEQYKRDAQDLRDKLSPSVVSLSTILISAWILFCLTPLWSFSGYGNLLVIIGVSILLWAIAAMICNSIGDSKIRNWKEEHPNDPRSKYL